MCQETLALRTQRKTQYFLLMHFYKEQINIEAFYEAVLGHLADTCFCATDQLSELRILDLLNFVSLEALSSRSMK